MTAKGKGTTVGGLRLPIELHDQLAAAAAERGVTLNWLVVRLCREGMERLKPLSDFRLTEEYRG